ncbi:MAG: hypothetical protein M1812_001459 [Candelaria pacifica]|nr:MAG: hypothetical protein M1812_001459 [Candelaria pacifica]
MKTALVTGATGLLGRQVVKAFDRGGWKVVGTGFTRAKPPSTLKVDLGSQEEIEKVLDDATGYYPLYVCFVYDLVSSFKTANLTPNYAGAANRFPDKCDADPAAAKALNTAASQTLAHATSTRSILLIYISTDYVFPGKPGEAPYEADSHTEPPNIYGQTKLDGEKAILAESEASGLGVVLRVPVLYGEAEENKESAINVLMDAVQKVQEKDAQVKMDDWAARFPTNTEDVARVCYDIAVKYSDTEPGERMALPKILQFSSEDRMTKYGICEIFAEIMGVPLDGMMANKEGNVEGGVQRPFDTHLSNKALRELGISVKTQSFVGWWRREVGAYRK